MGSITKLATAIVVREICKLKKIDISTTYIEIPKRAEDCSGTRAFLKKGDQITILDCLYGLILPSGNDAAITLANHFGKLLFDDYRFKRKVKEIGINLYVDFFVLEMNRLAKKNLLKNTIFSNPHGLSDKGNRSTAMDLSFLTYLYMRDPILKEISKTRYYEATILRKNPNEASSDYKIEKVLKWRNTNLLLNHGNRNSQIENVIAGKTGITPNACSCLTLLCESKPKQFIIVLLGSITPSKRWEDAEKLINFARSKCLERRSSYHFNVTN